MLETEIKKLNENIAHLNKLNENIAHLNKLLEAMSDTAKANAKDPEVEVEDAPGYTTDDIKAMALAISRKDRSKQKDIKAKLAEHDAKVATDLSGVALQAVGEWLSALKTELEA